MMQRYQTASSFSGSYIEKSPTGELVKYNDHVSELHALLAEILAHQYIINEKPWDYPVVTLTNIIEAFAKRGIEGQVRMGASHLPLL